MKSTPTIFFLFNLALLFVICIQIASCGSSTNKGEKDIQQEVQHDSNSTTSGMNSPHFSSTNVEVKTFEVKDSTGESKGWGYDIYVSNKKTIHQPIIPAVPGNRSFKTEIDAMKTGLFAKNKMLKESSLPTLLVKELDSLGVTK